MVSKHLFQFILVFPFLLRASPLSCYSIVPSFLPTRNPLLFLSRRSSASLVLTILTHRPLPFPRVGPHTVSHLSVRHQSSPHCTQHPLRLSRHVTRCGRLGVGVASDPPPPSPARLAPRRVPGRRPRVSFCSHYTLCDPTTSPPLLHQNLLSTDRRDLPTLPLPFLMS